MKNLFTATALSALFMAACAHFEEPEQLAAESSQPTRSTAVVPNQNPYSLENVQEAYDDLAGELGLPPQTITATHHYVRFDIRDSLDYMIVHDNQGLELIEYPLDRELTVAEMNAYMENTSNTWYYTVVPTDFVYSDEVDYEFLDDIYMQEEGEPSSLTRSGTTQIGDEYYDLVIQRAMQNNGIAVAPQTRGAAWYPSATIKFVDDMDRNNDDVPDNITMPLKGVKVRCTHFINVGSGTTDSNGNVSGIKGWGGRFRNSVGYHIIWENEKWNIRDGRTGQAKTHGPKQRGHWTRTITNADTKNSYFAAVHRALWAYFYETYSQTAGIIKARVDKMDTGVLWDKSHPKWLARFDPSKRTLGGNLILVYGKDGNLFRDSWDITRSTFHELGHATHWQTVIDKHGVNRISDYHNANDMMCESLARGIEYAYMRALYPNYTPEFIYSREYTAVVESMMNQGMPLKQIADAAIVGNSNMSVWRANVTATGRIPSAIVNMIFSNDFLYGPMRVNMTQPISGTDSPGLNVNIGYSVPAALPAGITFSGWAVTPNTFTTTGGMNNRNLTIKFTAAGTYTLSANFILPGNVSYTATKTVTTPTPPYAPTLTVNNLGGGSAMLYATNYVTGINYYIWELNGVQLDNIENFTKVPYLNIDAQGIPQIPNPVPFPLSSPKVISARCFAVGFGNAQWSNTVTITLPYYP